MSGSCETCEKNAATLLPVASSTISVKRGRIQSWNIVRVSRTCKKRALGDHLLLDRGEAAFQPCHHDVLMDQRAGAVGTAPVVLGCASPAMPSEIAVAWPLEIGSAVGITTALPSFR